jgi:hypothetical protein
VREIAPCLAGLSLEELDGVGYVVIDAKTDRTLVSVPPAATNPRLRDGAPPDG